MERMITSSIAQTSNDGPTGLQELADIVNEWGNSFGYIQTSAAFVKTAKVRRLRSADARPLLDRLAGMSDGLLPVAEPRQLANVLWACGKLQYTNRQLWSSTLTALMKQLQQGDQDIKCMDIANVLHGLANAAAVTKRGVPGVPAEQLTPAVCQLAECMRVHVTHPLLEGVNAQDIHNTLWACAKLRINPGDAVLNSLLQSMARPAMLEAFVTQTLGNTVWAVSELRQRCSWQPRVDQRVWQRLLGEQQLRIIADGGSVQNVTNTLVGLGRLCLPTVNAACAGSAISMEYAQHIAVQLLKGKLAQHVDKWEAQQISNTMWACGRLGVRDAAFLDRAAAAERAWLPKAIEVEVKQVGYACRVLQIKDDKFMAGLVKRSQQLQQQRGVGDGLAIGMTATAGHAVALLDRQQLASDVKSLVANCGVTAGTQLLPADASMLWDVHAWLVQHQLLDGQGLVGLLSQQQLEQGRTAAESHRIQEQQQQQQQQLAT
jgi:hypothetical protein